MSVYPRVFVTRLSDTVDDSILHEFFSRWVSVRWARLAREPDGTSKNYGFVEGETEQDAKTALELDQYELHGRRIIVRPAKTK